MIVKYINILFEIEWNTIYDVFLRAGNQFCTPHINRNININDLDIESVEVYGNMILIILLFKNDFF